MQIQSLIRNLPLGLLIATLTGCATTQHPTRAAVSLVDPLPPLGRVAIVPRDYPHRIGILEPSKGQVYQDAMNDGAKMVGSLTYNADTSWGPPTVPPDAAILPLIATPIATVTIVRANVARTFSGTSAKTLAGAAAQLSKSRAGYGTPSEMAAVLRAANLPLPRASSWVVTNTPSIEAAQRAGAETALSVEVLSLALKRQGSGWRLQGHAIARVVRVSDQRTIQSFTASYLTPADRARPLQDWTSTDSPVLHSEVRLSVQAMAESLGRQFAAAAGSN